MESLLSSYNNLVLQQRISHCSEEASRCSGNSLGSDEHYSEKSSTATPALSTSKHSFTLQQNAREACVKRMNNLKERLNRRVEKE